MAVFEIWDVRGRFDHPIDYAANENKTVVANLSTAEYESLQDVIRYAVNNEKTKLDDYEAYVSGINCNVGDAFAWLYRSLQGAFFVFAILRTVAHRPHILSKTIRMDYLTEIGIRGIAAVLNESGIKNTKGNNLSFSTIKNILINPKYKGYYCGNKSHKYDYRSNERKIFEQEDWVMYKDEENVPAIVSEELWEKANEILSMRSKMQSSDNKSSYSNKYKYSCKIICGEHKTYYYRALYKYKTGDRELWQCKLYAEKGRAACTSPVVYTSEIDEIMRDAYEQIILKNTDIIHDLVKTYSTIASASDITQDIAKLQIQINSAMQKRISF